MEINAEDLIINTFTNATPCIHMSIMHIPSGILVKDKGFSDENLKKSLLLRLTKELAEV